MIPFIIAGVVGLALLVTGCTSEEDEEKAKPSEKHKCDSFEKFNPKHRMIDQASFDAMRHIWKADVNRSNATNWHQEARLYIGAAEDLFKTSCTTPAVNTSNVQQYFSEVRSFFGDHYSKKASSAEDGMLVLIGGLAPADLGQTVVQDALDTMAHADESQRNFSELIYVCYRFNAAMKNYKERFLKIGEGFPTVGNDSSKSTMWNVGAILSKFDRCSNVEVGREKKDMSTIATCRTECRDRDDIDQILSDRQQAILNALREAYYYYTTGRKTRPVSEEFRIFITDKDSCETQNVRPTE